MQNEKEELLESVENQNPIEIDTEIKEEKQEDDIILENDFKSIVKKHKKQGTVPLMDLINLLDKFDEHNKWKIIAQICSYSIIFVGSSNLLNGVEQFMMLIQDRDIANSDIVTVSNGLKCELVYWFCLYILGRCHFTVMSRGDLRVWCVNRVFFMADV